jgi:hypothetical protein
MRKLFLSLLTGLIVGSLAPVELVSGVNCSDISNTHDDSDTCCSCGNEDFTVDELATTGSSGLACIEGIEVSGVEDFIFPNQCDTVSSTPLDFTVLVDRDNCTTISVWYTEASVGGTNCGKTHIHNLSTGLDTCPAPCNND